MNARPLLKYMLERHRIYLKRKAGLPAPWTTDPILSTYKFTNVYRELDRVTIWIREHIREPFADHPHLWFMLAIARRINWPPTLGELIADRKGAWPYSTYRPERLMALLDARTARKEQIYTGAYMITAEMDDAAIGQTKSRTTAYSNLYPLWEQRRTIEPALHGTLEEAYNALLRRGFAWGPFMTYEVVSDLRWTRYLADAPDVCTWANAGPGAERGLARLLTGGILRSDRPKGAVALKYMCDLLTWIQSNWPSGWLPLELREIEHSLCEMDKYLRVKSGEGRPRSKFTPFPLEV